MNYNLKIRLAINHFNSKKLNYEKDKSIRIREQA